MCAEFNGADQFSVGGINNGDASAAKSDVDFFPRFIITDIIGIIFKIQFSYRLERFSIVDPANTPFVICNEKPIEFWNIGNSLRCPKTRDRVEALALAQIDYLNRVVAQRAHEQSFTSGIGREMVDASFDAR